MSETNDKKVLTAEAVLQHEDQGREQLIEVPQWGGWVRCRRLSVKDRNELFAGYEPGKRDADLMLGVVERSLVEPTLTRAQLEDMSASALDALAMKLIDLNGWTEASQGRLAAQFPARP